MEIETAVAVARTGGYSEDYRSRAIEVLVANARRYQFLREFGVNDPALAPSIHGLAHDDLDAVIDAAMRVGDR